MVLFQFFFSRRLSEFWVRARTATYCTSFTVKGNQLTALGHSFMSRSPSAMMFRPVCHNTVVGLLDADSSLEAMQYYQGGSARRSWASTSISLLSTSALSELRAY